MRHRMGSPCQRPPSPNNEIPLRYKQHNSAVDLLYEYIISSNGVEVKFLLGVSMSDYEYKASVKYPGTISEHLN